MQRVQSRRWPDFKAGAMAIAAGDSRCVSSLFGQGELQGSLGVLDPLEKGGRRLMKKKIQPQIDDALQTKWTS